MNCWYKRTILAALVLVNTLAASATEYDGPRTHQFEKTVIIHPTTITHRGDPYLIRYEPRTRAIALLKGRKRMVLSTVERNYDPGLVDAEKLIGFLPAHMQVYQHADVLVYVSAVRSSGGNGGGQCGSGAEVFLNFLDVTISPPKAKASLLVTSCYESIELDNQDLPQGILGDLTNADGHLSMQFLIYKNRDGSLKASVSKDFRTLEFE